MTSQRDTTDRDQLKSLVRGRVHFPDGDGYRAARQVWNGMIDRRPAAFGHRDAMFNLTFLAIGDHPALDTEQKSWARGWQAVAPHSTGSAYLNYLSEGEDMRTAYHDARFQRLSSVKAQYDPANLFRFNQNIPPAEA